MKLTTILMLCALLSAALLQTEATIYSAVNLSPGIFSCSTTTVSGLPAGVLKLATSVGTFAIGYRQLGVNKDPIYALYGTNGQQVWCQDSIENSNDDGTGTAILYDDVTDLLYMAFTCTGNQPGNSFQTYATNGWFTDCGGGGSKRSVVAQITRSTGIPTKATYIRAVLSNGNPNTWVVIGLGFDNDMNVVVQGNSTFSSLNTDKTRQNCTGLASGFRHDLTFPQNLGTPLLSCSLCNQSTNVIGCRPPIAIRADSPSSTTSAGSTTTGTSGGSTTTGTSGGSSTTTRASTTTRSQGGSSTTATSQSSTTTTRSTTTSAASIFSFSPVLFVLLFLAYFF